MASKNIAFDQIPNSIRKPGKYFEFNTKLAVRTLPANKQRMLIVAPRLITGTIPALTPTQVFSDTEAALYFGEGSVAHLMVRAAIKANAYLDLSVCAPDDPASAPVARVHTLVIAGPATGAGAFTQSLDDVDYVIDVANEDTAAEIAIALKAALDDDPQLLFTVELDTATLVFTAKTPGVAANAIVFDETITATGVTGTPTETTAGADSAPNSVARVHTLAFTGPATGSASLTLYIGNTRIQMAVSSGDTAVEIAAALVALLANYPDLPFTAAQGTEGNTHKVIFTAQNGGTIANQIDFAIEITAPGITGTFTATTAGSVNPDIAGALAAVFGESYNIIASPFTDAGSLADLKDHLDNISAPLEQRPCIGVFADDNSLGIVTSLAIAVNSGRVLCAYLRGTRSPAYEIAAAMAAVMAYEEDPARPLNLLALPGIAAPPIASRFSRTEQETLLYNGVTPLEVGPGEVVQIVRAISTYIHDPQGIDDIALLDITTIRTLDYVREAVRARIALRFPREKLSTRTPAAVRDQIIDVLEQLEDLEIVEAVDNNADGVICERDSQDPNRLNAKIPCDVVNGLHVFAGRIDLLL